MSATPFLGANGARTWEYGDETARIRPVPGHTYRLFGRSKPKRTGISIIRETIPFRAGWFELVPEKEISGRGGFY
jgi:hypothetical protein